MLQVPCIKLPCRDDIWSWSFDLYKLPKWDYLASGYPSCTKLFSRIMVRWWSFFVYYLYSRKMVSMLEPQDGGLLVWLEHGLAAGASTCTSCLAGTSSTAGSSSCPSCSGWHMVCSWSFIMHYLFGWNMVCSRSFNMYFLFGWN